MKRANGTGTVEKIGGKRTNKYRARVVQNGVRKTIGYYPTRKEGIEALNKFIANPYDLDIDKMTFEYIFKKWSEYEYPTLSEARKKVYDRMFLKCETLHKKIFKNIRHTDFSKILDLEGHTNNIEIKNLFSKMSNYAMVNDIIQKDYSQFMTNRQKKEKVVERKVYTEQEIQLLWDNLYKYREVDTVLIMIYSGLRIGEILKLSKDNIDLDAKVIKGAGIKTDAGKNRVIPIHSKIYNLIEDRYNNAGEDGLLFTMKGHDYYTMHQYFKRALDGMTAIGVAKHTAHDCRHTFATRMNDADSNSTAIKNIIGHTSFDLTEKIYTHKSVEKLRKEIEKIN